MKNSYKPQAVSCRQNSGNTDNEGTGKAKTPKTPIGKRRGMMQQDGKGTINLPEYG
jgi:hypothetical protein